LRHVPFPPSGYKTEFDGFANSLMLLLNDGDEFSKEQIIAIHFTCFSSIRFIACFFGRLF
jgi:hypothetical protein